MNEVISITILDKEYEKIDILKDKCYKINVPTICDPKKYYGDSKEFNIYLRQEPAIIKWLYSIINSDNIFNIKVLIESNGEQFIWCLDCCSISFFDLSDYTEKDFLDVEDCFILCNVCCKGVYFEQNGKRLFAMG